MEVTVAGPSKWESQAEFEHCLQETVTLRGKWQMIEEGIGLLLLNEKQLIRIHSCHISAQ